jgi:DNA-binding transcriptional regulator of glucitol operon
MSSAEAERPAAERERPKWLFLISPRWLGWHALAIFLICGMLALGYWQYRRAEGGNTLSWAYTFEWPVFALFGVVFWVKTIRDEFKPPVIDEAADRAEFGVGPASPEARGKELMVYEPEDPELVAYNAYLSRLNDQVKDHGRGHGLR